MFLENISRENELIGVEKMNVNELGFLWYLQSSSNMINIFLKYLIGTTEDVDVKEILKQINEISTHQEQTANLILSEKGFKSTSFFNIQDDLYNPNTKLFSDQLTTEILKHVMGNGLKELALQYSELTDLKIKKFFKELLDTFTEIDYSLLGLLGDKGMLQNSSFSYKNAEERKGKLFKVKSTQQRPLNAVELSHMFSALECNNVGVALCAGFSEVVKDDDIKNFLLEGEKLAFNQASTLSNIFRENGVPTSTGLEAHVNKIETSPFSDKLIANLIMFLNPIGITNLQSAIVVSYKRDHINLLKELIKQVEDFSEKGFKLLVRKNWFHEPPLSNWMHK